MALSVTVAGFLLFGAGEPALRSDNPPWLHELSAAQAEARRTGRLIFAVLH